MAHIHTAAGQHDITVSAHIVRLDFDEPKLMLHVHRIINKIMVFGGHVELDEDPMQTLYREVKEESGYDPAQLKLLQPKDRIKHFSDAKLLPYPIGLLSVPYNSDNDHYHDDLCYAFITHEEPKNPLSDDESKDIRLFTRDELVNIPNNEIIENIRESGLFVLDECLKNWERIDSF